MKEIAQFFTGTVLTGLSYILGGWNLALQTLLIFITLDYITGICKAIYLKKLSSEICFKGIIRKVGFLVIVALANYLDKIVGDTGALYNLVVYFFVANEGISIVENWASMDLPIPKVIRDALLQLKGKSGEELKKGKERKNGRNTNKRKQR